VAVLLSPRWKGQILWIIGLFIIVVIFWSEAQTQVTIPPRPMAQWPIVLAAYVGVAGLIIIGWILSKPSWTHPISEAILRTVNGVFNKRRSIWMRFSILVVLFQLGWVTYGAVVIGEGADFASDYPVTRVGESSLFSLSITLNATHVYHDNPYLITIALTNISNETQRLGFSCSGSKQYCQPWLMPHIYGVTYSYHYFPIIGVGWGGGGAKLTPGETMTATHMWKPPSSLPEGIYKAIARVHYNTELQSFKSEPVFFQLNAW
jgi:hypothetical protein